MKNIHILPTDKPSRLHIWINDKGLRATLYEQPQLDTVSSKNIYITSDEEIKIGDYYIHGERLHRHLGKKCLDLLANKEYTQSRLINKDLVFKKVVLTTDQDLIKDGVQAIDDEFLEWFVKNPSCEFVETEHIGYVNAYNIIIPKKEPKFVTVNIESAKGEDLGKVTYIPLPNIDYIPKQETPEELVGAKAHEYSMQYVGTDKYTTSMLAIQFGYQLALEQAERMYSEEDMKKMYKAGYQKGVTGSPIQNNIEIPSKEWFEQFKKK